MSAPINPAALCAKTMPSTSTDKRGGAHPDRDGGRGPPQAGRRESGVRDPSVRMNDERERRRGEPDGDERQSTPHGQPQADDVYAEPDRAGGNRRGSE